MYKRQIINWSVLIFIALIITYISVNVYRNRQNPHALQVEQKHYADSLIKACNDIIFASKKDSAQRTATIIVLTDSINSLNKRVNENDEKIKQSQAEYITKTIRINTLSTDSLALFFTHRFSTVAKQKNRPR